MPWVYSCGLESAAGLAILSTLVAGGFSTYPHTATRREGPGVILFDESGPNLLQAVHEISEEGSEYVLALSSSAVASASVWQILQAGAADVLTWDPRQTLEIIEAKIQRWTEVDELLESPDLRGPLIGRNTRWRALLRQMIEAGHFTDSPILILGESGTGKELLAQLIHKLTRNRNRSGELITVDCTTIVPELSGSELFGHERGAFTGAAQARDGAFALANGGTLFLDEVGELPLLLQAQLLRAVQEKVFKRVGGNSWQQADFRLVCATNRDLLQEVGTGGFRADLYYRLATFVFRTIPLRERRDDIVPLARYFLSIVMTDPPDFDSQVIDYLNHREYPGNVRDLRQLVTRIAYRHAGGGPISAGDLPREDRPSLEALPRIWPDGRFEESIAEALDHGAGLEAGECTHNEKLLLMLVNTGRGRVAFGSGLASDGLPESIPGAKSNANRFERMK